MEQFERSDDALSEDALSKIASENNAVARAEQEEAARVAAMTPEEDE